MSDRSAIAVREVDPIGDPRWAALVAMHPRSSVFHTPEWIAALKRTYDFEPIVYTTSSEAAQMRDGIVLCEVASWLTGKRLVSLPFSDHCEPLFQEQSDYRALLSAVRNKTAARMRYSELRPATVHVEDEAGFYREAVYCRHVIDLDQDLEVIHSRFHGSSIRRKLRRAERENVFLDEGRSESLLHEFYGLMLLTRRRHHLPPQPLAWFRNLIALFGVRLNIRVARKDGAAIAAMITLRHKDTLTYKYGCSDARLHKIGAVPRLFWEAIQGAKSDGLKAFDLGRSAVSNEGLIQFKEHLGAIPHPLTYWRVNGRSDPRRSSAVVPSFLLNSVSLLPDRLFRLTGKVLYPHVG